MMVKTVACKYDGTCSLFREKEGIIKLRPIWIDQYVTDAENPLKPTDDQLFTYETSIYHLKDLSQYPKLDDDMSDKKNRGIKYSIVANVEQKYANPDLNLEITRGKLIVIISNINLKDLTHGTIVSKNSDVNITIGD
jgi:hypothetical protein